MPDVFVVSEDVEKGKPAYVCPVSPHFLLSSHETSPDLIPTCSVPSAPVLTLRGAWSSRTRLQASAADGRPGARLLR